MKFSTNSLLSKWGFDDGDILDGLLYDNGLDVDAHKVLIKVVKTLLLAKIKQNVEVIEIHTIHNPIRAQTVDGVEINNYKYGHGDLLTPKVIDIDDDEIIKIAKEILSIE